LWANFFRVNFERVENAVTNNLIFEAMNIFVSFICVEVNSIHIVGRLGVLNNLWVKMI